MSQNIAMQVVWAARAPMLLVLACAWFLMSAQIVQAAEGVTSSASALSANADVSAQDEATAAITTTPLTNTTIPAESAVRADTSAQVNSAAATTPVVPAATGKLSYEKNAGNTGSQLFTVALSLGLIIALIFGLSLFVRRFGQGLGYGGSQIKVVASMSVGTRERLSVIEVGGQQILIGVTATQINTLHVFDSPVITPQTQAVPSDFAQKFKAILSSQSAPEQAAATPARGLEP